MFHVQYFESHTFTVDRFSTVEIHFFFFFLTTTTAATTTTTTTTTTTVNIIVVYDHNSVQAAHFLLI